MRFCAVTKTMRVMFLPVHDSFLPTAGQDLPHSEGGGVSAGHTVCSVVERVYQRDALLAKRRGLMADWAEFCGPSRADDPCGFALMT